jgi:hypothetical protein
LQVGTTETAVRTAAADGCADLAKEKSKAKFPPGRLDLREVDFEELAEEHAAVFVQKSGPVDLAKVIGKTRPRILTCHRNVVSGWSALERGDRWLHLQFFRCKTDDDAPLPKPVPVEVLRIQECDDATVAVLLASVQAMELSLSHARSVNLGSVHGRKLETLAFIQSIEAEDLSEAIDELAAGTKLKERRNVADAWRDW